MTVEHTEIRHFIQRFNDSYDGFPYGFCTFRTVAARFPAWFGELGAVRGSVVGRFRGLQERLLAPLGRLWAPRPPVRPALAELLRTGNGAPARRLPAGRSWGKGPPSV